MFLRRPGRSRSRLVAYVVRAEETATETRRLDLARLEDLAEVDFAQDGEPVATSLVLVCGHGSRDACCALRGTAVYGALVEMLGDEALWISSHQGGHRFAANVLVLPVGVQLGRVETSDAADVTAHALAGRIELSRLRGRTCYEAPVQAAEHAIRQVHDLDGIEDLRLAAVDGSLVRFRARDGHEYAALVEKTEGPAVPASCGAAPEPQPVYRVRLVEPPGVVTNGADRRDP
jgi:hypothetical protein